MYFGKFGMLMAVFHAGMSSSIESRPLLSNPSSGLSSFRHFETWNDEKNHTNFQFYLMESGRHSKRSLQSQSHANHHHHHHHHHRKSRRHLTDVTPSSISSRLSAKDFLVTDTDSYRVYQTTHNGIGDTREDFFTMTRKNHIDRIVLRLLINNPEESNYTLTGINIEGFDYSAINGSPQDFADKHAVEARNYLQQQGVKVPIRILPSKIGENFSENQWLLKYRVFFERLPENTSKGNFEQHA